MRKLSLFCSFLLFITMQIFSQQGNIIFQEATENNISQEAKTYFRNIVGKGDFKKIKIVKLLKTDFSKSEIINIPLFNNINQSFTVNNIKYIDSVSVAVSAIGDLSTCSFVFRNRKVSGTIQIGKTQFSIVPLGDTDHAILEVDYSKYEPEAPPIETIEKSVLHKESGIVPTLAIIDILVAYTPAAKNATQDIVGLIENAIYSANLSFTNDDLLIEYNLVHTTELNYTEGTNSMLTILNDFRTNTTIQNLRNEYSADICFLITDRFDCIGSAENGLNAKIKLWIKPKIFDCIFAHNQLVF